LLLLLVVVVVVEPADMGLYSKVFVMCNSKKKI
jgi:hypothetical protein